jgi:hypothetical protein
MLPSSLPGHDLTTQLASRRRTCNFIASNFLPSPLPTRRGVQSRPPFATEPACLRASMHAICVPKSTALDLDTDRTWSNSTTRALRRAEPHRSVSTMIGQQRLDRRSGIPCQVSGHQSLSGHQLCAIQVGTDTTTDWCPASPRLMKPCAGHGSQQQ